MRRPRLTIAAMMGGVLVAALGMSALREPSPERVRAVVAADLATLASSFVAALLGRGPTRACAVGALALGGAAFVAAQAPGPFVRFRSGLPEVAWLRTVHEAVAVGRPPSRAAIPRDDFDASFSAWRMVHPDAEILDLVVGEPDPAAVDIHWRQPTLASFLATVLGLLVPILAMIGGLLGLAVDRRRSRPEAGIVWERAGS